MVSLQDILNTTSYTNVIGKLDRIVKRPIKAGESDADDFCISWISDRKLDLQFKVTKGVVICSNKLSNFNSECTYIIVENPRLAFRNILSKHFEVNSAPFISNLAYIHNDAVIGNNVTIEHFAVIEEGCIVGDNCVIGSNTVLKRNTVLGEGVKLGSNNTVGGVGFGYEKDLEGNYSLMPHLGNVVIGDFAEIGNNTCIDRAVVGSTLIGKNAKIDNLVHIAHGVVIGENSLIIAHAMIGGSTVIGKNVWFAPTASVLNNKHIEDNAVIGMGAVVLKDVKAGETIVGNPGKPLSK